MQKFSRPIQVRWSDIDAIRHLRHSVYYDYAASLRMLLFQENGITTDYLEDNLIGPVLFREEAVFKREIRVEDSVVIDVELVKATHDLGRWSMRHNIYKNGDTLAAVINIDAAWIDMKIRKLAKPNDLIQEIFKSFPKSSDFNWIEPSPIK